MSLAVETEATVQYMPPPLFPVPATPLPRLTVNPSRAVVANAPCGEVTTVPALLPSRTVRLANQLRWSLAVSVPTNPPNNPTRLPSVISSVYVPFATHTSSAWTAVLMPAWTVLFACAQLRPEFASLPVVETYMTLDAGGPAQFVPFVSSAPISRYSYSPWLYVLRMLWRLPRHLRPYGELG